MDEAANQGDKAKSGAAAQPASRVSLFGRGRKNGNGNGAGDGKAPPPKPPRRPSRPAAQADRGRPSPRRFLH